MPQRIRSPPLIPSPTPISLLCQRQPFDAAEPLAIECLLHYECKQHEVSSWHNDVVNWSLLHQQVLALGGLLPRFHSGRGHSSYGTHLFPLEARTLHVLLVLEDPQASMIQSNVHL
ncbi:hypothetical protein ACQJBY_002595 [Aegilops geniculata]